MTNYTPINVASLLRETGGADPRHYGKKKGSFDRVFFPFSIMMLVLALSFYAVKLMLDITTLPKEEAAAKSPPQEIMKSVKPTAAVSKSPTESPEKLYIEIGQILFDPLRISDTSKEFYPDISGNALRRIVKKSILEWAALKKYYESDAAITNKLTIDTDYPIATYGAVLKELDTMKSTFSRKNVDDPQFEIDLLVNEYKKSIEIRLEP